MPAGNETWVAVLLCSVLSWVAVGVMRRAAPAMGFIDVPNERSSHVQPTPRAGGLGFVLVTSVVAIVAPSISGITFPDGTTALFVGGLLVAIVGLADDRWHLPARLRLTVYLLAAFIFVGSGHYLDRLQWAAGPSVPLGWLGVPLTVVWLVAMTNIYNFMDGIDGIASTQGIVALAAAGLVALSLGNDSLATVSLMLAGSVLGFLPHNWPPAKIFMGDVGSAFLGFSIAGLAVIAASSNFVPFYLWVVLLAPFLFDSVFTLAVRVTRGERWYEAHRQHLYQRLVRRGWSHLRVTSVYLCADLYFASLVAVHSTIGLSGSALLLLTSAPLFAIFAIVRWVESTVETAQQPRENQ